MEAVYEAARASIGDDGAFVAAWRLLLTPQCSSAGGTLQAAGGGMAEPPFGNGGRQSMLLS